MALSEDMKKLSREFAEAWDTRTVAVASIRADTATMLRNLGEERAAMGAEQRAQLLERRARLTADVAASRKVLLNDLAGASAAWAAYNATMAKRRAAPVALPPAKPPAQAKAATRPASRGGGVAPLEEPTVEEPTAAAPEPARPLVPDDLTSIRGIGSAMQRHLNDQGVHSFAQLAEVDADELRRKLGTAGRVAGIEDWKEEAGKLIEAG